MGKVSQKFVSHRISGGPLMTEVHVLMGESALKVPTLAQFMPLPGKNSIYAGNVRLLPRCEHDGRRTSKPESHAPRRICDESRPECSGAALTSLSQLLCRLAAKPLQIGLSAVRILPQLLRLLLNPLQADHHSLLRVY